MKERRGSRGLLSFSLTLALDGSGAQSHALATSHRPRKDVGGVQCHVPATLPLVKRPGMHFSGCWVGLRVGVENLNPRTILPVAGCYTDHSLLAHRVKQLLCLILHAPVLID
jgi:hypothetical protein